MTDKRTTPEGTEGMADPPRPKKRAVPTIDLTATEVQAAAAGGGSPAAAACTSVAVRSMVGTARFLGRGGSAIPSVPSGVVRLSVMPDPQRIGPTLPQGITQLALRRQSINPYELTSAIREASSGCAATAILPAPAALRGSAIWADRHRWRTASACLAMPACVAPAK